MSHFNFKDETHNSSVQKMLEGLTTKFYDVMCSARFIKYELFR